MTWMTPFDASMSAATTVAELMVTVPIESLTRTSAPLTVATAILSAPTKSELMTFPGITW